MKKILIALSVALVAVVCGILTIGFILYDKPFTASPEVSINFNKIIPAADGSIYVGYSENSSGDISTFEQAVGKKVALTQVWPRASSGSEKIGKLEFSPEEAQKAWDNGYVTMIAAYEAIPFEEGFTVDRLIQGEFDEDLKKFAEKLKEFGKPVFFSTAREPNGAIHAIQGGFGVDGDLTMSAARNQGIERDAFDPSGYQTDHLSDKNIFNDLARPDVCDGLERLAAAQRYYYDFFVNREGINFLTFDTMGWTVRGVLNDEESISTGGCGDFETFLGLVADYSDWISINWYLTPPEADEKRAPEPSVVLEYGDVLARAMKKIRAVAPDKPVMFTELGFCQLNKDKKAEFGLNEILSKYPEIKAFMHWGNYELDDSDCGISELEGAQGFRTVFEKYPEKFSSCVMFSDGSIISHCSAIPTEGVLPTH